ncbi:transposase, partial [Micromonospora aurantiaca]
STCDPRPTRSFTPHAELRLGTGVGSGRKRVARLMRQAGLQGF